jgi:prepilin-type N-terminal cleavage/methylation domain-containing protein/prepilin-type processing-associated H-X9-DG protein
MSGQSDGFTCRACGIDSDWANSNKHSVATTNSIKAFSLIELIVVISIISLLIGIVMPVVITSRAQGKQLVCRSNLRQLLLANTGFAGDNDGSYVHAALDIFRGNKHRWYGVRDSIDEPFDTANGPLAPYLGRICIKCTTKVNFTSVKPSDSDYDEGSGGYGYNMTYIGSSIWKDGYEDQSCKIAAKQTNIRQPAKTLMFADTAMSKFGTYIEYSFAEPRYFVVSGEAVVDSGWDPSPSIHFKHRGKANIGWVDGHLSSEKMGRYDGINDDGTRPAAMNLGWFEPMDNTLFDLK